MKSIQLLFTALVLTLLWGCENVINENSSYDYVIEQKMECYCDQSGVWVKLYVSADTVSAAVRISDNSMVPYNEFKSYKSIKELFNIISETDTNKYNLVVQYDTADNYPSFIYKNPKPIVIDDSTIVRIEDAQISYTTRNFTKLEQ